MINVFYSYFRDIMIKSKLNNRIVQVTHISSIHDFSIIQEKDLRWSNELKSQLNHPELLSAAKMFQDKVNLKIGETVLAQHPRIKCTTEQRLSTTNPTKCMSILWIVVTSVSKNLLL